MPYRFQPGCATGGCGCEGCKKYEQVYLGTLHNTTREHASSVDRVKTCAYTDDGSVGSPFTLSTIPIPVSSYVYYVSGIGVDPSDSSYRYVMVTQYGGASPTIELWRWNPGTGSISSVGTSTFSVQSGRDKMTQFAINPNTGSAFAVMTSGTGTGSGGLGVDGGRVLSIDLATGGNTILGTIASSPSAGGGRNFDLTGIAFDGSNNKLIWTRCQYHSVDSPTFDIRVTDDTGGSAVSINSMTLPSGLGTSAGVPFGPACLVGSKLVVIADYQLSTAVLIRTTYEVDLAAVTSVKKIEETVPSILPPFTSPFGASHPYAATGLCLAP